MFDHIGRTRAILSALAAACLASAAGFLAAGAAHAQTCGQTYTVQSGDNLFYIANRAYGDEKKWPLVFYTNRDKIGSSPSSLVPNTELYIPCLASDLANRETGEPLVQPAKGDVELRFLTGDAYEPFSDRNLPGQGMFPQLIREAVGAVPDAPSFGIFWVNRWAVHLDPLLTSTAFDMGFPWLKPDCTQRRILSDADVQRCEDFHFSDPVADLFVEFYMRSDSDFEYSGTESLRGKIVCRPEGYYTFDLDQDGRNWLANGIIRLERPETPLECFQMLVDGDVDFVALNNMLSTRIIQDNQWSQKIRSAQEPISTQSLHILIAKNHPRSREYLRLVNEGIERLREEGRLARIAYEHTEHHLTQGDAGEADQGAVEYD